ncbi:MAG: hypothetical protein E6767_03665 [Dysgonomonas sp.]|nr:hypothetical protein [Dysgonomonas sp.]
MKNIFGLLLTFMVCSIFLSSCFGEKKPDKEISYQGVSFNYPYTWKNESGELDNNAFYMLAENRFSKDNFFLVYFTTEKDGKEDVVESFFESLSDGGYDIVKESTQIGKFREYDCKYINYKLTMMFEKLYGIIYSFDAEGRSFCIVKQSGEESDLKDEKFNAMENSFDVQPQ